MATKKNKKGAIEDTANFIVIEPIKHDGEDYQVDEIIALTEKEAAPLLGLGVIIDIGAIKVDDEDFDDDEASSQIDDATEIKSEIGVAGDVESSVEANSEIETKPEVEAS